LIKVSSFTNLSKRHPGRVVTNAPGHLEVTLSSLARSLIDRLFQVCLRSSCQIHVVRHSKIKSTTIGWYLVSVHCLVSFLKKDEGEREPGRRLCRFLCKRRSRREVASEGIFVLCILVREKKQDFTLKPSIQALLLCSFNKSLERVRSTCEPMFSITSKTPRKCIL
jgi:hypothetical protein